jgi:hypothetical protein
MVRMGFSLLHGRASLWLGRASTFPCEEMRLARTAPAGIFNIRPHRYFSYVDDAENASVSANSVRLLMPIS